MAFKYYPPPKDLSEIHQEELRNKYYVQLSPDGSQLVPGTLQQDIKPDIGNWMYLGNIDRQFSKRYFIQYTDFNTLVPGSLIQTNKLPKGNWKEIKPLTTGAFHRFVFPEGEGTYQVNGNISEEAIFTDNTEFLTNKIYAPMNAIEPGEYHFSDSNATNHRYLHFFHFPGSFSDFDGDLSKLIPFGPPPAYFAVVYTMFAPVFIEYSELTGTHPSSLGIADLRVQPETPNGTYSFVLSVIKPNPFTLQDYVAYYIFLENILIKSDASGE